MKVNITRTPFQPPSVPLSSVPYSRFATNPEGGIYFATNEGWVQFDPYFKILTKVENSYKVQVEILPVGTSITLTSE